MMRRASAWWAQGPSTPVLIAVLALAGGALLVRWQFAAPVFSQELGFLPFDLQGRLNQGMLAIQIGAASGYPLIRLYAGFVAADIPASLAIASATAIFWRWLHLRAPNRIYRFLTAGGIVLVPVAVAALELGEHQAVFNMLRQRGREGYADAVARMVVVHNIKMALAYVRDALTLAFIVLTAIFILLRRRSGHGSPG